MVHFVNMHEMLMDSAIGAATLACQQVPRSTTREPREVGYRSRTITFKNGAIQTQLDVKRSRINVEAYASF